MCFWRQRGAHVCKNREQIWPKNEKDTLKALDGELDADMCGLGGAENENVHAIRARSKIKTATSNLKPAPTERPGAISGSL